MILFENSSNTLLFKRTVGALITPADVVSLWISHLIFSLHVTDSTRLHCLFVLFIYFCTNTSQELKCGNVWLYSVWTQKQNMKGFCPHNHEIVMFVCCSLWENQMAPCNLFVPSITIFVSVFCLLVAYSLSLLGDFFSFYTFLFPFLFPILQKNLDQFILFCPCLSESFFRPSSSISLSLHIYFPLCSGGPVVGVGAVVEMQCDL